MTDMTLAELEAERKRIEDKNEYWRTHPAKDGSYEAAMSYDGYYTVLRKIQEMKDGQRENGN